MTNKRKIFLELFNLNESASIDDIKKRYRELAKMFHPDKNNEKNAHERFLLIKEAYEYLINTPFEKAETIYYESIDLEKERIEKIRKAKEKLNEYYKRQDKLFEKQYQDFLNGYLWKFFKTLTFISTILTLLIWFDLSLPSKKEKTFITEISENYNSLSNQRFLLVKTINNDKTFVNSIYNNYINQCDSVSLTKTALLNRVIKLETSSFSEKLTFYDSFQNSYFVLIISVLILLPLYVFLKKEKSKEYIFIVQLVTTLISPLTIYFILTNIHFS